MVKKNDFYMRTAKEIFEILKTDEKGLSGREVEKRLSQYGNNQLEAITKTPKWLKFLLQFKDVLVIILIVAGIMSFAIGNFSDGTIMFIIVLINAIIGYIQEYKAERIMDSLQKLVQSPAKVYRDNKLIEFPQVKLVPGDIVYLDEGDKVPADIRIMESLLRVLGLSFKDLKWVNAFFSGLYTSIPAPLVPTQTFPCLSTSKVNMIFPLILLGLSGSYLK